mmetsp:Transcript_3203/g.12846  ORF Transcript_3203/g.12846 Transcript_3203/m.12846 type:complete len:345 (+) Transcript_3203:211-1245(+)
MPRPRARAIRVMRPRGQMQAIHHSSRTSSSWASLLDIHAESYLEVSNDVLRLLPQNPTVVDFQSSDVSQVQIGSHPGRGPGAASQRHHVEGGAPDEVIPRHQVPRIDKRLHSHPVLRKTRDGNGPAEIRHGPPDDVTAEGVSSPRPSLCSGAHPLHFKPSKIRRASQEEAIKDPKRRDVGRVPKAGAATEEIPDVVKRSNHSQARADGQRKRCRALDRRWVDRCVVLHVNEPLDKLGIAREARQLRRCGEQGAVGWADLAVSSVVHKGVGERGLVRRAALRLAHQFAADGLLIVPGGARGCHGTIFLLGKVPGRGVSEIELVLHFVPSIVGGHGEAHAADLLAV